MTESFATTWGNGAAESQPVGGIGSVRPGALRFRQRKEPCQGRNREVAFPVGEGPDADRLRAFDAGFVMKSVALRPILYGKMTAREFHSW